MLLWTAGGLQQESEELKTITATTRINQPRRSARLRSISEKVVPGESKELSQTKKTDDITYNWDKFGLVTPKRMNQVWGGVLSSTTFEKNDVISFFYGIVSDKDTSDESDICIEITPNKVISCGEIEHEPRNVRIGQMCDPADDERSANAFLLPMKVSMVPNDWTLKEKKWLPQGLRTGIYLEQILCVIANTKIPQGAEIYHDYMSHHNWDCTNIETDLEE
jgi:hypothetical protein